MKHTLELERAAYIANDPRAPLLARIADLERLCVKYETALDAIAHDGAYNSNSRNIFAKFY
jgi:hypothetical protein